VYKLFLARYGMKTSAQSFFNRHLKPAFLVMAEVLGNEVARQRFSSMVVD
jgi:hypothetical protein